MAALVPERITEDEALDFARAVSRHFHEDETDDDLAVWARIIREPGADFRGWVVRDDAQIVANYGVYGMDVSLPGGARVPAAGVTAIGVAQTHRRRGLLSAMMRAGLDDAVDRDEPVALLYASESVIYGRFGFGVLAPTNDYRIERGLRFRDPIDVAPVQPIAAEQPVAEFPAILEQLRRQRPGAVTRTPEWWRGIFVHDPASVRDGASGRRLVHVPGRGYASYRVKTDWKDNLATGEVRLEELVATDPDAEAALWQYVTDIDLTSHVVVELRPPDDALREMVADPFLLHATSGAPLYARLVDVGAAFSARAYTSTGRVTIAVVDPACGQSGTWLLDASPDGASMTSSGAEPDLEFPIDALASVWLGGVRTTQLVAARRVVERHPGAAARLDRLVATDRAPWTPFMF